MCISISDMLLNLKPVADVSEDKETTADEISGMSLNYHYVTDFPHPIYYDFAHKQ